MKYLQIPLFLVCLSLTSCGSFGEGMLTALAGYNSYGYANPYSYMTGTPAVSSAYYPSTATSSYTSTSSSTTSTSRSSSSSSSSSTRKQDCPSLKMNNAKWYCSNTGKCGMCGGDGLMDGSFGLGANSLKCTLCNGSGRCKYCR